MTFDPAPSAPRPLRGAALIRRAADVQRDRRLVDLGMLVIRIALAWIFVYHGAGTLFGAFHGAGLHATSVYFADTAHLHPGMFFAVLGGIIECFGGVAIGLGLLGRLCGLALFGDMVIAMITVTWANGINSDSAQPGYELNLALAALALAVALLGSGRLSLDYLLGRVLFAKASRDEPADAAPSVGRRPRLASSVDR